MVNMFLGNNYFIVFFYIHISLHYKKIWIWYKATVYLDSFMYQIK